MASYLPAKLEVVVNDSSTPLLDSARPARPAASQTLPRLVKENGTYKIRRRGLKWQTKYVEDLFHTLAHQSTGKVIILCTLMYAITVILFAGLYRLADAACDLKMHTFKDAVFFSLETLMTIGYGADDIYFGECSGVLLIIAMESMASVLLGSACFGLIFARISRGTKRASTVAFSSKAIMQKIRGQWYFKYQIADTRKHQLIESRTRMYAVRHAEGASFQTAVCRMMRPDDQIGGYLLLALPQHCVHKIDAWSPLCPLQHTRASNGNPYKPATEYLFPDTAQKSQDVASGNRDADFCECCGESYHSHSHLLAHWRSNLVAGEAAHVAAFPSVGPRALGSEWQGIQQGQLGKVRWGVDVSDEQQCPSRAELEAFFRETNMEVVILVEGDDSTMSLGTQARHSYHFSSGDILFEHEFQKCVFEDLQDQQGEGGRGGGKGGGALVDFQKFHETYPLPTARGPNWVPFTQSHG